MNQKHRNESLAEGRATQLRWVNDLTIDRNGFVVEVVISPYQQGIAIAICRICHGVVNLLNTVRNRRGVSASTNSLSKLSGCGTLAREFPGAFVQLR